MKHLHKSLLLNVITCFFIHCNKSCTEFICVFLLSLGVLHICREKNTRNCVNIDRTTSLQEEIRARFQSNLHLSFSYPFIKQCCFLPASLSFWCTCQHKTGPLSPQHFNFKGNMGTFLNMSFQSMKILFACKLSKLASAHSQNRMQLTNASICILMHTIRT